jgi:tetratricopeptide (TPR) repeat protein
MFKMTTPSNASERQTSLLNQAQSAFQEALALIDRDQEPGSYGVVLHDIAVVHKAKGDLQKATASYREAVQYKLRADNPSDLATTLLDYGDLLIDCAELTEARTVLDQTKEMLAKEAEAIKPEQRAVHFRNLGLAYERLAEEGQDDAYVAAFNAYQATLSLIDADTDPGSYATVLRDIGDVQKAQGHLAQAVAAYEAASEHMRRLQAAQRSLASILIDLGRARRRLGMQEGLRSTEVERSQGDQDD